MRIHSDEIRIIVELTDKIFGSQAQVLLFGSRLTDTKKGGDIDLLIKSKEESVLTLRNKVKFLTELKIRLGEQKVDVVFENTSLKMKSAFYESIIKQAKKLERN